MNIEGSHTLNAAPATIWPLLHDPHLLAQLLPGCDHVAQTAIGHYQGQITFQAGPMRGQFEATVHYHDSQPPQQIDLTITIQGKTGNLQGNGRIQLTPHQQQTILHYQGKAHISGDISSAGDKLLSTATRAIIRQSLTNLETYLTQHLQPRPAPSYTQLIQDVGHTLGQDLLPPPRRSQAVQTALLITASLFIIKIIHRWWQKRPFTP